ncbi:hypothetical protein KPL78_10665 [Roseomonas sp. HJA6]|uniref:Phage holin family protein n=1 Tax=Roseomonas alba TaxID=2846776 RepID=A0ABS7A997_9PROT|nr:hypothetical protein [Neoroseomonas alba]MBW6398312.1 hypothetical protein [Neoroseomonas alba]
MRVLQMLDVAAQAEGVRLRREATVLVRRAGWIAVAGVFGTAALATAHVAAVAQLVPAFGLAVAAAMIAAADLVLAGIFAMLARPRPDPVAEEARALRQTMLASVGARNPLRDALGFAATRAAVPLLGAVVAEAVAGWLKRR